MRQYWTVLHGQPPEHPDADVELVAVEIASGQTASPNRAVSDTSGSVPRIRRRLRRLANENDD